MAAVLGRTEIGIKKTGTTVSVPSDPKAKLMYYLSCMCSVLDLSDTDNLSRLREFSKTIAFKFCRNYRQYYSLSEEETDALVMLCFLLSPDELSGKVIFQDAAMCGSSSNEFYEISAVRNNLLVSDSIIIGGQRRSVSKIMAFKQQWLIDNWVDPMKHFAPRLARIASAVAGRASNTRAVTGGATPPRRAIAYNTQPEPSRQSDNDDCCCVIL